MRFVRSGKILYVKVVFCMLRYFFLQILIFFIILEMVRHTNRGRLLLRTPGPIPLWDLHVF